MTFRFVAHLKTDSCIEAFEYDDEKNGGAHPIEETSDLELLGQIVLLLPRLKSIPIIGLPISSKFLTILNGHSTLQEVYMAGSLDLLLLHATDYPSESNSDAYRFRGPMYLNRLLPLDKIVLDEVIFHTPSTRLQQPESISTWLYPMVLGCLRWRSNMK